MLHRHIGWEQSVGDAAHYGLVFASAHRFRSRWDLPCRSNIPSLRILPIYVAIYVAAALLVRVYLKFYGLHNRCTNIVSKSLREDWPPSFDWFLLSANRPHSSAMSPRVMNSSRNCALSRWLMSARNLEWNPRHCNRNFCRYTVWL
jgi:hypothetical protein